MEKLCGFALFLQKVFAFLCFFMLKEKSQVLTQSGKLVNQDFGPEPADIRELLT